MAQKQIEDMYAQAADTHVSQENARMQTAMVGKVVTAPKVGLPLIEDRQKRLTEDYQLVSKELASVIDQIGHLSMRRDELMHTCDLLDSAISSLSIRDGAKEGAPTEAIRGLSALGRAHY